ncbi:MAG: hypothetical protein AB7S99_16165 [Pseudodonghicola sp.]
MTLSGKTGGVLLGLVFFAAVLLVKPIGVSAQFVILDGILGDATNAEPVTQTAEGYTSTNAYLAKSGGKYAGEVVDPLNCSFVLAMVLGGFASTVARGGLDKAARSSPAPWRVNFGDSPAKRDAAAFVGGFIALAFALPERLAGQPAGLHQPAA